MKMNKINIALVCTSVIFFYIWVAYALDFLSPRSSFLSWIIAPFLGIISLFGSLLFVSEMKNKSNRWYLGIPLSIAIFFVVIAISLDFFHIGGTFPSETSLTMLAPCSILFFLSVPADQRKMVIIPVLISSIISSYALYSYYYLLRGMLSPLQTSWNVVILLLWLYWAIGTLIIGICLVAIAVRYKK